MTQPVCVCSQGNTEFVGQTVNDRLVLEKYEDGLKNIKYNTFSNMQMVQALLYLHIVKKKKVWLIGSECECEFESEAKHR